MNIAGSSTITIPSYTGSNYVPFVKGTEIKIILTGEGTVTISGASGVTVNSVGGLNNIETQWGTATLIKRDTNNWVITGDLS